jgi:hypothetical protein
VHPVGSLPDAATRTARTRCNYFNAARGIASGIAAKALRTWVSDRFVPT